MRCSALIGNAVKQSALKCNVVQYFEFLCNVVRCSAIMHFSEKLGLMPNDNMEGDKLVDSLQMLPRGARISEASLPTYTNTNTNINTYTYMNTNINTVTNTNRNTYMNANINGSKEGKSLVDSLQMVPRGARISEANLPTI